MIRFAAGATWATGHAGQGDTNWTIGCRRRCKSEPAGQELEFLSDNGGAYIAADTRALVRSLGLKPINTPVCSPQSNGKAESFVNTFKRDYMASMDLRDARTVLAQLPAAFEHFNEVHPHSSLKMRSPREFRRQQAAGADRALCCE